jgi:hypothetical protein
MGVPGRSSALDDAASGVEEPDLIQIRAAGPSRCGEMPSRDFDRIWAVYERSPFAPSARYAVGKNSGDRAGRPSHRLSSIATVLTDRRGHATSGATVFEYLAPAFEIL